MHVDIKKHKSNWGFWSFEDSFTHNHVEVPGDCYNWQDDLSHSLQDCLEKICYEYNKFADRAWEELAKSQDIGVEEMDPYQSQVYESQKMRINV